MESPRLPQQTSGTSTTMNKTFAATLGFFLAFTGLCSADISSRLNITSVDGTVSNWPYKLMCTNGSLTDNGDGTMTLNTGSGGGGSGGNLTNLANQYSAAYYSFAGSSNTLSGATNVLIYPSSMTIGGAPPLLSTSSLTTGTTLYASSGTIDTQFTFGGGNNYSQVVTPGGAFAGVNWLFNSNPAPGITPFLNLLMTNTSVGGEPKGFLFENGTGVKYFAIDPSAGRVTSRALIAASSGVVVTNGMTVDSMTVTSSGTYQYMTASHLAKTDSGKGLVSATSADVIAEFTSCSGIQYLGADGACHTVSSGGASALAVFGSTGANTTTVVSVSSPTPALLFDTTNMILTPNYNGTTTYVALNPNITASTLTMSGSGNLSITENGTTGQIVISTAGASVTVGHCAQFGSSMSIVDAGAACGTSTGGGNNGLVSLSTGIITPAVITSSLTVSSSTTLGTLSGSTTTITTILGQLGVGTTSPVTISSVEVQGPVIFNSRAGDSFANDNAQDGMILMSRTTSDRFNIQQTLTGNFATMVFTDVGGYPRTMSLSYQGGSGANLFSDNVAKDVSLSATPVNGDGRLLLGSGSGHSTMNLSLSSVTVSGAGGMGIIYNVNAGSMTGAGLTTCTTMSYNATTGLFGCSGTSGGSASTLEIGLGTSTIINTRVSSPTSSMNLNQSQFSGSLVSPTTAFISISYSTAAITASMTVTSTHTVVAANCASACTVTLPTAVGISGKVYHVKIIGTGVVTIATTSSQTIDGTTTIIPNPNQWANIEVISDGSNWSIL